MTATMKTVTEISVGFLTGNYSAPIDADATATRITDAIGEVFPDAKIAVRYQDATGCVPLPLRAFVVYDDGETADSQCNDENIDAIERIVDATEPVYSE